MQKKINHQIIWRGSDTENPLFLDHFENEMNPGQTFIDFGCGSESFVSKLLEKGLKVFFVGISPLALNLETQLLLKKGVSFVQAPLWEPPKNLEQADWIFCSKNLEKVPERLIDPVLEQMAQKMTKRGYFSIPLTEQHPKSFWEEKIKKYFCILLEDLFDESFDFNCAVTWKEF